jgi:hypothetical protein
MLCTAQPTRATDGRAHNGVTTLDPLTLVISFHPSSQERWGAVDPLLQRMRHSTRAGSLRPDHSLTPGSTRPDRRSPP